VGWPGSAPDQPISLPRGATSRGQAARAALSPSRRARSRWRRCRSSRHARAIGAAQEGKHLGDAGPQRDRRSVRSLPRSASAVARPQDRSQGRASGTLALRSSRGAREVGGVARHAGIRPAGERKSRQGGAGDSRCRRRRPTTSAPARHIGTSAPSRAARSRQLLDRQGGRARDRTSAVSAAAATAEAAPRPAATGMRLV
jgi:hypothetical protein